MMLKFLLLGVVACAAVELNSPEFEAAAKWPVWKATFPDAFRDADESVAFKKFAARDAAIMAHNAAGDSWTMAHNKFSAMTPDEFVDQVVGRNNLTRSGPYNFKDLSSVPVVNATALDWRTKGAVTPVKNQAQCGSCWAFSTTGSFEGAYQIATGKLVSFSEQQLVSCDKVDSGCNGGLMDNAFKWIKSGSGLCTETAYPYTSASGITGTCKKTCTAAATLTGHVDVKSEADLMNAIQVGPVSVAIEADKTVFQSYSAGVIGVKNPAACGKSLDHGVLVVGYGTASQLPKYPGDHPYWLVKNSWDDSWGEKGYVRILRDHDVCGIADGPPSYPTGVHAVSL